MSSLASILASQRSTLSCGITPLCPVSGICRFAPLAIFSKAANAAAYLWIADSIEIFLLDVEGIGKRLEFRLRNTGQRCRKLQEDYSCSRIGGCAPAPASRRRS